MTSVRTSHSVMDQVSGSQSSMPAQPASAIFDRNKIDFNGANYEKSLFSSSMSDMFARKLRLSPNEILFRQPVAVVQPRFDEEEPLGPLKEIEAQTIGDLLPNDDELLAGIHDLDCVGPNCNGDDSEDLDLFSSIGGLELGVDEMLNERGVNRTPDFLASLSNDHVCSNNSFTGEHPCGQHPSRTLFVRNININIEDSELKALFEQYGHIRELYTACKPRGFFIISYYDIRAARNAMSALQNKIFRGRNLDIHYSIPKDNSSEKDLNREALVVLNLDSSVTNDELRQNFGVYGEIKEIRENPHKRHQKLIEFYDVREAEAALRALNKSDIAGKRTKLEASRLGGARRLFPNFSMELEHEQSIGTPPQGVPGNLLPGCYAPVSIGALNSNGLDNGPVSGLHSSSRGSIGLGQLTDNGFLGHSHGVPHSLPTLNRVSSISGQSGVIDPSSPGHIKFGFQSMANFHPHSLPDYSDNLSNGALNFNTPSTIASGINALAAESISNRRSTVINQHSFDEGSLSSANGTGHIHGRQYLWGNTNSYHPHSLGTMMWQGSSSFVNGSLALPVHGLNGSPSQMISSSPQHHHHVGSAPANNPSWDHRRGFVGDVEPSLFHPGSLGSMGFSGIHPLELAPHNIFSHVGGNGLGHPPMSSSSIGIPSPQQRNHLFSGRSHINPSMASSFDGRSELRLRNRRNDTNVNQIDNKKLYELEIDRIKRGEDSRTTLMIKNIPNKYTSKMLLAAIDERHRGTYDFIYLPIDFKNKCNVGYAFINMIDTMHIVPFYEAFNGKKWEKFNSEKVALLAYARIQGKSALIAHFQNSSLMNEDKRCRPILFHSKGPNAGDQEPFPLGSNIRSRPGKSKITNSEETHQGNSPPSSINIDESTNGRESPPGFSSD